MQFSRFFISDGQISYSDTVDSDTLNIPLLLVATQALQQLQSGAEQVSKGLPCTVRLGTSLPHEQLVWVVQRYPEKFQGKDAQQVKTEQDERCRQTQFELVHSGKRQRYRLLRAQNQQNRAGLHGALGGMMFNRMLREDRHTVEDKEREDIESIEEFIWQASPAVYTNIPDFGRDVPGSSEMISFSAYFAAAMLLVE